MRYTGEIDADLMQEAMALSGLPTKRATLDAALRDFIREKRQASIRRLRGEITCEGDLDTVRSHD